MADCYSAEFSELLHGYGGQVVGLGLGLRSPQFPLSRRSWTISVGMRLRRALSVLLRDGTEK
eukprot:4103578-Pyramimonas_sp.AAC.1